MSCQPRDRGCYRYAKRLLRRELGAAFRAAALQDEASGFRCHAGTETVRACALDFAWLIRTFHLPVTWVFCKPLNDLRSGRAARLRRCRVGVNRPQQTLFNDRRRA